jgi:hypothetical protein
MVQNTRDFLHKQWGTPDNVDVDGASKRARDSAEFAQENQTAPFYEK